MSTRLNKYIASSGLTSRRKADELIESGAVKVNGKIVKELGFSVSSKDKVTVYNEPLKIKKLEYYRFYKPAGYITTSSDEKGRKTIYDILPEHMQHLKPVGRLDKDSSGLLILTNDGDLINELTHPSIKVAKVYRVVTNGRIKEEHQMLMAKGIEIEGKLAYADTEILEASNKETVLKVVLYQGLNRQIRKMFDYLGFTVVNLKRIQHASLDITGLKKGEFKLIKPKQIKELKAYLNKIKRGKNA